MATTAVYTHVLLADIATLTAALLLSSTAHAQAHSQDTVVTAS